MTENAKTVEEYQDDQIVVAIRQVEMVRQVLTELDVRSEVVDESSALGLTLLNLDHDDVARAAGRNTLADPPALPLGRLLQLVYRHFARTYNGWVPTMGKNRIVRPIMGAHNIGGGGRCKPVRAKLNLAPRDDEPGRGVRVGIADTALYAHPWLAGAYAAAPASMWPDDKPAGPESGHATFIAGLILQRAPGVTLEVRRVLGPDARADSWDVAKKLISFGRSGLDVLNLSLGTVVDDDEAPLVLSTVLDRLDPGVVVVAAAGNHGASADAGRPTWPAAYDRVVAVTAADHDGRWPEWTTNVEIPWVDAVAPGADVASTFPTQTLNDNSTGDPGLPGATWSGTSFAAALVSGAIAAQVVPGEFGANAALAQLLRTAPRLAAAGQQLSGVAPGKSKPWIK